MSQCWLNGLVEVTLSLAHADDRQTPFLPISLAGREEQQRFSSP